MNEAKNSFTLRGRRAVITGGSRGIGGAVTRLLAEAGADVCIGYHSRRADADALAAECIMLGVKATHHASDISTPGGADALIAHAVKEFGGLDICVHSAGIWPVDEAPVSNLADDRWANTMRQNVDAMFFISRAAARAMEPNKPSNGNVFCGRIVHIASTAGQRGESMHADYAASKGAMISFVKSMAVELAPRGITVNAVAPGVIATEMSRAVRELAGDQINSRILLRRVGQPEEVAHAVWFLSSRYADYITGQVLHVDGGFKME